MQQKVGLKNHLSMKYYVCKSKLVTNNTLPLIHISGSVYGFLKHTFSKRLLCEVVETFYV